MDVILPISMENTRVEYSDTNVVDFEVVSKQDIEAVTHYSVPNIAHRVATVFQVWFEKINLSEM